jgi:hypothetical protein
VVACLPGWLVGDHLLLSGFGSYEIPRIYE